MVAWWKSFRGAFCEREDVGVGVGEVDRRRSNRVPKLSSMSSLLSPVSNKSQMQRRE